jgi:hypothetical protein
MKPYDQMYQTARGWAEDDNLPDNLRSLAQCLAENAARLSEGILVDDKSWDVYARFGCTVCSQLGHAICTTPKEPIPDCPLGLWGVERDLPPQAVMLPKAR